VKFFEALRGNRKPQGDVDTHPVESTPHTPCGEPCPRCGFNAAVETAAKQLISGWRAVSFHPRCVSSSDLAVEFVRDLKRFPIFAGKKLRGAWIRQSYPVFCWSRGVDLVPYKDFARELATLMPRSRGEEWRRGRRTTYTRYLVPAENVVDLAAVERKRA
jgi:hypothetical protein